MWSTAAESNNPSDKYTAKWSLPAQGLSCIRNCCGTRSYTYIICTNPVLDLRMLHLDRAAGVSQLQLASNPEDVHAEVAVEAPQGVFECCWLILLNCEVPNPGRPIAWRTAGEYQPSRQSLGMRIRHGSSCRHDTPAVHGGPAVPAPASGTASSSWGFFMATAPPSASSAALLPR